MIPEHLIFTGTTAITFGNLDFFHFTVTFTVFGEVLKIRNHFLELPEAAQKLSYDKVELGWHTVYLEAFETEIRELLPFVYLGEFKTERFKGLTEEDFNHQIELKFFSKYIKNPLLLKLWRLKMVAPDYSRAFAVLALNAERIRVEEISSDSAFHLIYEGLRLSTSSKKLVSEISLEKLINDSKKVFNIEQYTYHLLTKYPSDAATRLLSSQLLDSKFKSHHLIIANYLCEHGLVEFEEIFITHLSKNITANSKMCILLALAKYKNERIEKILLDNLENAPISECSIIAQKNYGFEEALLAQKLYKYFKQNDSTDVMYDVIIKYDYLESDELLPSNDELIAYLRSCAKERSNSLSEHYLHLGKLIHRRANTDTFPQLISLLRQEDKQVIAAGVEILGIIGDESVIKGLSLCLLDAKGIVVLQELICLSIKQIVDKYYLHKLVKGGMTTEVKQDIENTFIQVYEETEKKINKSKVIERNEILESIAYIFRYFPNRRTKIFLRRIEASTVLNSYIREIATESLKFIKQQKN